VASLSGTISGLQAGVNAAQAAASSASAAAGAIDLSGLSSSLATLQAEVDAIQASLATTATASAVTALQAEIDAIEADLDDLLSTSNIYSSDVNVTNATTLNAALALGNKINVLNASMTITGYSGMDYTKVQQLVDRVNTTTGNIVYTAAGSTGTEIIFNNLVSAANITMTQPGGYQFPKLANAAKIDLKDDYETTVTTISFPALTTATSIETDDTGTFEVIFTYATSVDFGALATAPSNTITITTKKDATLDLGSWVSKDASGNYVNATLTLNGPASFTNGTAAGTFASTGLPGNTLGAHDGTITLTNVATAAIHNFRGTIDVNGGVKNFTGNNIVTIDVAGAAALETINLTMMRDNDPANSAATNAANAKSSATAQDVTLTSTHAKLTSATITGSTGDISFTSVPLLATVDLTGADAFDVSASGNASLTSWTDASKAEDRTFNNNDLMTSVSLSATTKLTVTGDKAVSVSVDGNAELTSLTVGMDDVNDLDITSNPKLATISGATAMKDNGTDTVTDVKIYGNALVASLVRDTKEAPSATVVTGATSDTGSITTASGIKDLDAFLTDAIAATGTVSVWFDTVTKLEIQATYGGTYTDTTSSLTAPSATPTGAEAVDFSTNYTGYYAYAYADEGTASSLVTNGARSNEIISWAYDVKIANNTFTEVELGASAEGISITTAAGTTTFDEGDSYTGAANGTTVETVDDLVAYLNADTALNTSSNVEVIAARDSWKKALYSVNYTNSTLGAATLGVVSSVGGGTALVFQFGTTQATGDALYLTATLAANDTQDDIADAVMTAINAHAEYSASTITSAGSNFFVVTKNVSGSPTQNTSPLQVSFPSISFVIDAAQTSTTATLTPSAYNVASNLAGKNSSLYTLTAAAPTVKNGLRVTLKNTGSVAMPSTTTVVVSGASNTAIATSAGISNGVNGVMLAGKNIPTWVSTTYEAPEDYVTTFAQISAGTQSGSAAVAAKLTNRTGW
jgi:hypothetical protein